MLKKLRNLFASVFVAACGFASFFTFSVYSIEISRDIVGDAAFTQLSQSEDLCLEATKLYPSDWDRFTIVSPYQDLADFPWRLRWAFERTNIGVQDEYSALVFKSDRGHAWLFDKYEIFLEHRDKVVFDTRLDSLGYFRRSVKLCFDRKIDKYGLAGPYRTTSITDAE